MGRQKGIMKLQGQVGDMSFYQSKKDGFLARKKEGINGDRIRTDPRFERTRENGAEFGRAGVATKLFRKSLHTLLNDVADSRMTNRLMADMVRVLKADTTNPRGLRNVVDGEAELLKGFEFNANGPLQTTFKVPITAVINRETGRLEVSVPAYVPKDSISAPPTATHAKLTMAALEVDFETGKATTAVVESPPIALGRQIEAAATLAQQVTPASKHPLFIVFGVSFSQIVNGVAYALKDEVFNAMAIVEVNGGV